MTLVRIYQEEIVAEDVEYVGIGKLRQRFSSSDLKSLRRPIAITGPHSNSPLGVLLTFDQYVRLVRLASIARVS
jgi:hypothetical protein